MLYLGLATGRMLTPGPASSGNNVLLMGKNGRNCLSVLVEPEDNPGCKALRGPLSSPASKTASEASMHSELKAGKQETPCCRTL